MDAFHQWIADLRGDRRDAVADVLDQTPRRLHDFLPAPSEPASDRLGLGGAVLDDQQEQWLPLHHAAHAGAVSVASLLIERGASPDCRTRARTPLRARATPLHLAADAGHAAMVALLLDRGAAVEVRDAFGKSPLHLACYRGLPDAARRLLDAGAMPDPPDDQGRSPLHEAVRALADAAGDPPLQDADAEPADPVACALLLLERHADADARCPKEPAGYTPLHRCVAAGPAALPIARALLAAGADPTAADPRFGRTPRALAEHLGAAAYLDLLA